MSYNFDIYNYTCVFASRKYRTFSLVIQIFHLKVMYWGSKDLWSTHWENCMYCQMFCWRKRLSLALMRVLSQRNLSCNERICDFSVSIDLGPVAEKGTIDNVSLEYRKYDITSSYCSELVVFTIKLT